MKVRAARVVAGYARKELFEERALGASVGTHRRQLGQEVARIMFLTPTGAQVDGAVLDVEEPRIGIKLIVLYAD